MNNLILHPSIADPLYFTHIIALEFVKESIEKYRIKGKVLDLGCGQKPYESLFPKICKIVGTDISPNTKADYICNNWELPLKNNSVDAMISTFVLEHTLKVEETVREIKRVLKPGGVGIITVPFTFPLHEIPHDYWRFTPFSLKSLFVDFEILELKPSGGYCQTLATMINLFLLSLVQVKILQKILFGIVNLIALGFDKMMMCLVSRKYQDEEKYMKGYYSFSLNYLMIVRNKN